MLRYIIAALTASVSIAGCSTAVPTGQPHTVNRPITGESKVDEGRRGAPGVQAGSTATTQAADHATAPARNTDAAAGSGNTGEGAPTRDSTLNSGPPRDTGGQ